MTSSQQLISWITPDGSLSKLHFPLSNGKTLCGRVIGKPSQLSHHSTATPVDLKHCCRNCFPP